VESQEEHKRCLDCGYILTGLVDYRCPECGRTFDPDNPETYTGRPHCGVPMLIAVSVAVGGTLAACGLVAVFLQHLSSLRDATPVLACLLPAGGMLFASIAIGSCAVSKCLKALDLPHGATCHRSCFKLALGLGLPFKLLLYLPCELTILLAVAFAVALLRIASCS
jgi:hypothetical protein